LSLPAPLDSNKTRANPEPDPAAFAALYDRYVDGIYWYCRRWLLSPEEAEDATSLVFTKALAAGPRYGDPSLRSWLFRIAHNVVLNEWRAKPPVKIAIEHAWEVVDAAALPEELAIMAEERARLEAALRSLPDDQRRVMDLHIAGLTGPEVATVLGRSHGAVKMLRQRAHVRLRELLSPPSDREEKRND
jgi:RNA polymerase sigma-70 factor (ECF subfamily)